jgi:predicted metal-dependent RNase
LLIISSFWKAIEVIKNIMSTNPLRVGILGCAGIASKTALAISNPATNCVVRAVASRSPEKAEVTIHFSFDDFAMLPSMIHSHAYIDFLEIRQGYFARSF